MEAKQVELEAERREHLRRASEVACRLQKLEQGRSTPHYDQIESAAHDVGQRLSRMVQQERTGELAADQSREATCPQCRNKCPVSTEARQVTSVDGPVELMESVAFCTCCRKNAIFVSAVSTPSDVDPQPDPLPCFLDRDHVAKIAESMKIHENTGSDADQIDGDADGVRAEQSTSTDDHKPRRLLRTFVSGLDAPREFGQRMRREANKPRGKRLSVMGWRATGRFNGRISKTTWPCWISSMR